VEQLKPDDKVLQFSENTAMDKKSMKMSAQANSYKKKVKNYSLWLVMEAWIFHLYKIRAHGRFDY
jgi:hypothetical protein